jgi:hypothetical protein
MIRRISILSLVGLLMASMLSCKAVPMVVTPTPTPTVPAGIKSYTSEEAKLSIQYPEEWIAERTILEGLNAVLFRETVEEGAPEFMVLYGSAEGQTTDQVLDKALTLIQTLSGEAGKDWQVGEAEFATPSIKLRAGLGEKQGRQLFAEYTRATSGVRHKVYLLGIVGHSLSYAFTADAPLDDWGQNWHIFEAMLDSLRFGAE